MEKFRRNSTEKYGVWKDRGNRIDGISTCLSVCEIQRFCKWLFTWPLTMDCLYSENYVD